MDRTAIPGLVFFVLFVGVILTMLIMARPMLGSLIFGGIFAGCMYPFFDWLLVKTNWTRSRAAGATCAIASFLIVLPIVYLVLELSKETLALYQFLKGEVNEHTITRFFLEHEIGRGIADLLARLGVEFDLVWLKANATQAISLLSGTFLEWINQWVTNVFGFTFDIIIMILVMFALFKEGHKLKRYLFSLSPLPDHHEELILKTFNQMNYVTLVCNGVGGLLQAVLASIGFWIAGLPSVLLWGFVMLFLAFIPILGISLVYIPACIYLYLAGYGVAAFGLFTYCTVVALVVENWFKPRFIGQRIRIDSLFVLFCILGGMGVFGMAGVFYGPVIGIIFLTMVEIYHDNYAPEIEPTHSQE